MMTTTLSSTSVMRRNVNNNTEEFVMIKLNSDVRVTGTSTKHNENN